MPPFCSQKQIDKEISKERKRKKRSYCCSIISSVKFSHLVMPILWPYGLQHAQASLSITSSQSLLRLMLIESVIPSNHLIFCHPLLLRPSIFPASGYFPVSLSLASGGQSTGVSALASVFPMNIQGWFPLGWTGWISLQSKGLSTFNSPPTTQFKIINSLALSFLYSSTLIPIHDHWKNHSLDQMDLCWQSNVSAF